MRSICAIYGSLQMLYNENDLLWLYVTLKRDLGENAKFAEYVRHDIESTQKVVETIGKPKVKRAIFNNPATIIYWTDGTKTVVKCQEGDTYDKEKGFVMAYLKKLLGNDNTFNNEINKWVYGG